MMLTAAATRAATGKVQEVLRDWEKLLNHFITTVAYTRQVAASVRLPDVEIAYVAGRLHDIGKLVLEKYVRVDYDQVRRLMQQDNLRLWQAEELVFGLDHAAVGGLMASRWQFPVPLVEAIKCHHWPSFAAVEPRLAAAANRVDSLAPRRQAGGLSHHAVVPHPEALRLLNLDEKRLERLRTETPGVAR
jgi:putative nucleotidyltransferase with HDIG domain